MKLQTKKKTPKVEETESKPKKTTKKANLSVALKEEDYQKLAKEYSEISEQAKVLTSRKSELSSTLKEGAQRLGTKDDKGSFYMGNADDEFIIGSVIKKSITLNNEKGYEYLKNKGLNKCYRRVVETKYVVDEDAVEKAISEGDLTLQEVQDNIYDISTSFSVSVKKQVAEEMPEIEQTKLVAAKKK